MIEVDIDDDKIRPLSIASSPTEDFLLFSTKISDSGFKRKIKSLNSGETVNLTGPFGSFVLNEHAGEIIMLGGGIGITPFRSMIKYAGDKKLPIKITLLYSNRTPLDIVYRNEWHVFESANSNFRVVHTVSDSADSEWREKTGRIDKSMINEFWEDKSGTLFYICGPPPMVNAMQEILREMQVPQQNVRIERFAGY